MRDFYLWQRDAKILSFIHFCKKISYVFRGSWWRGNIKKRPTLQVQSKDVFL